MNKNNWTLNLATATSAALLLAITSAALLLAITSPAPKKVHQEPKIEPQVIKQIVTKPVPANTIGKLETAVFTPEIAKRAELFNPTAKSLAVVLVTAGIIIGTLIWRFWLLRQEAAYYRQDAAKYTQLAAGWKQDAAGWKQKAAKYTQEASKARQQLADSRQEVLEWKQRTSDSMHWTENSIQWAEESTKDVENSIAISEELRQEIKRLRYQLAKNGASTKAQREKSRQINLDVQDDHTPQLFKADEEAKDPYRLAGDIDYGQPVNKGDHSVDSKKAALNEFTSLQQKGQLANLMDGLPDIEEEAEAYKESPTDIENQIQLIGYLKAYGLEEDKARYLEVFIKDWENKCTQRAEEWTQWAERHTQNAAYYTQEAADYRQRAAKYTQEAADYRQRAEEYTQWAEKWRALANGKSSAVKLIMQWAAEYTQWAAWWKQNAAESTQEAAEWMKPLSAFKASCMYREEVDIARELPLDIAKLIGKYGAGELEK